MVSNRWRVWRRLIERKDKRLTFFYRALDSARFISKEKQRASVRLVVGGSVYVYLRQDLASTRHLWPCCCHVRRGAFRCCCWQPVAYPLCEYRGDPHRPKVRCVARREGVLRRLSGWLLSL